MIVKLPRKYVIDLLEDHVNRMFRHSFRHLSGHRAKIENEFYLPSEITIEFSSKLEQFDPVLETPKS